MMKKIRILAVGLLALFFLVACSPKTEGPSDWLEGKWYNADWQVTYEIDEDDGKWTIEADDQVIVRQASLVVEDNLYTLTDSDGVSYIIEQESPTKILYQQVAPEGTLGTTARVHFEKVDD